MNVYLLDGMSIPEHDMSEYAHVLGEDRQTRIARYRRSADRRRSFGAGMALFYAWHKHFGLRAMPDIIRRENGKPCFAGGKIPFCLSHSGKFAACVLGEEGDNALGLDIQEPRAVRAGVVGRFFSEGEKQRLLSGDSACLIWSRKESLAKYEGSGLRGDLRLLDTAGIAADLQSGRTACGGEHACINRTACGEEHACINRTACGEEHACINRTACGGEYACVNCAMDGETRIYVSRMTGGGVYLWSCMTKGGYAVSVCTDRPVPCRLEFLRWEQIKKNCLKDLYDRNAGGRETPDG